MKFIDEKKINKAIVMAVLYLSFGFAQWQTTRGTLAYMSYNYADLAQATWLFNDIVALFMGGVVPYLLYELITTFAARFVAMRTGGATDDMKYALRFFYIGANLVIGALKFLWYVTPVISVFGSVIIDFVVTTAFFVWYLFYCAKHYVVKMRWGAMLLTVGGTYLIVEAVVTVANLLMGVLAS